MSQRQINGEPGFGFLQRNRRQAKPRERGLTEIRGPYYSMLGPAALRDLLRTAGPYVDSVKFAGGSFALLPWDVLTEIIAVCHEHGAKVSTGGFMERVIREGPEAVTAYIAECRRAGFDIIEISAGFISLPTDDWLRLIEAVLAAGLVPKPEVGVQFGAGGDTPARELEAEGQQDPAWAIAQARRFLDAGAPLIMVESEGITENVPRMRTGIPARFIQELGLERLMFEAADPEVFAWYVKSYGPEVNLFVDHSQILQLECLRQGLWGAKDLFGRVHTFKG